MARKKRSHIFSDFNTPESAFSLFENAIRVAMDYDAGVSDSFTDFYQTLVLWNILKLLNQEEKHSI